MLVTIDDLKNITFYTNRAPWHLGYMVDVVAEYNGQQVKETVEFKVEEMFHLTRRGAEEAVLDKLLARLNIEGNK